MPGELKQDRFCVVALFEPLSVGHRFPRVDWPAHVTIASNVRVNVAVDEVARAVLDLNGVSAPLAFVFGEVAMFGRQQDIRVRVADSPSIRALHRDIFRRLSQLPGFAPDEPAHWGSGYRPHLTLCATFHVTEGQSWAASQIALVRLDGPTAEIVASAPTVG